MHLTGLTGLTTHKGVSMNYSQIFVGTREQLASQTFDEQNRQVQRLFARLHPETKSSATPNNN